MAKRTRWRAWSYLWPFATQQYTLRTNMTPEQCWQQLKIHVAPEAGGRLPCPVYDSIVGWFHPPGFTIRRADGITVTPCPTVASGRILRREGGSRLTIHVGTAETGLIVVSLWLIAWLGFLFLIEAHVPKACIVRAVAYHTLRGWYMKNVFNRPEHAEAFHGRWHPDADDHSVPPWGERR